MIRVLFPQASSNKRSNDMKNSIRIVLVALVAIVLVLTVAVLSPRHTRALGPLSVNPTSPRPPWNGSCVLTPKPFLASESTSCQIITPADGELVVQSEVFLAETTGPSEIEQAQCVAGEGGTATTVWSVSAKSTPTLIGGGYTIFLTSADPFFADPATAITCYSYVHHASEFLSQKVILQGYYVSPPAS